MKIGDRIKQRRIELSMSQIELAEKASISKQTLYKYENNIVTNIPSRNIEMLAHILDTTPAYLMGWETDMPEFPGAGKKIRESLNKKRMTIDDLSKSTGIPYHLLRACVEDDAPLHVSFFLKAMSFLNPKDPDVQKLCKKYSSSEDQARLLLKELKEKRTLKSDEEVEREKQWKIILELMGDDFNSIELEEIKQFVEFIKSKRKN